MILLAKKITLFLWLITLPVLICAQQVTFRSSVPLSFSVPYRFSDGGIYTNGNAVLREMARDVLREPWQVRVRISFKLSVVIDLRGDKNHLSLFCINPVVGGDTVFRRFPVGDVLLPSKINMKLRWANRLDTTSFSEASVNNNLFSRGDTLVCSFPIASFDPMVDTLMIRKVELYYDSLAFTLFKNRLDLINDYYASGVLLDSLEQMAAKIHIADPAALPSNFLKVEEFNKVIERIKSRDFPSTLLMRGFDPGRLNEKYSAMFKQSRTLTFNFLDELKKTGAIPWNGNTDMLASEYTERILSYIHRSKLMDHLQSQIYQDFLDHCVDGSSFPPEENVFVMLFSKMYPDSRIDTMATYISRRIYSSYRDKAAKLLKKNQYSEAFSMMDHARIFTQRNPFFDGVNADDHLQSQAAYGIYNSYTGIAQECIRNRNYTMADAYLAKADQYARDHPALIGSDSLYLAVFSGLFFLRNSDCDLLLDQLKFEEALDCYGDFEKKYDDRDLVFVRQKLEEKKNLARTGLFRESALRSELALKRHQPDTAVAYYEEAMKLRHNIKGNDQPFRILDSLAIPVSRIRVDLYFNSGVQALDRRQYTLAMNQFNEARALSDQYGIVRDRSFDSLYRHAMKYYLIIQLSAAQKKIWANQFDSAYAAMEETRSAGAGFGLTDDPDFKTALKKYHDRIREQQCRNFHDSVEFHLMCADRSIALKNYLNSSRFLQQALAVIAGAKECGFATGPIRDTIARYSRAIGYQQKLSNARSHVAGGNYAVAVGELDENEQDYQTYRLDRFGLILEGVYDFIGERSNPYLTDQAISYYQGRGNNKEAIRFLRLLRIQGLPDKGTASIQQQLGKTLAVDDFKVNPKDSAMRLVEQYTTNDSWYDVFRSAYLKEWDALARSGSIGR